MKKILLLFVLAVSTVASADFGLNGGQKLYLPTQNCTIRQTGIRFTIQVEKMGDYRNVVFRSQAERSLNGLYQLSVGGVCMALSCTSENVRLSNTNGTIIVSLLNTGYEGKIRGQDFHCIP